MLFSVLLSDLLRYFAAVAHLVLLLFLWIVCIPKMTSFLLPTSDFKTELISARLISARGEIIRLKHFPESSKGWLGSTPRFQWYAWLPDCDTLKCLYMLPDASQGGKSAVLGSCFPVDTVAVSLRLETALLFFPEYACPLSSVSPPLIQSDLGRSNWKNSTRLVLESYYTSVNSL